MLLSGKEISDVELMTPKGIALRLEVLEIHILVFYGFYKCILPSKKVSCRYF